MWKMIEEYEIFIDGKRKAGFIEGDNTRDNGKMNYENFKKEFEEFVDTWQGKGVDPIRITYTIKLIAISVSGIRL